MDEINYGLHEKFARLRRLWHRQQLRGYAAGGPMADPTRGQGRILAALKLQDGISTRDLSYLLGLRVSSLNELLAKLEKSGHLTREPSEDDKRVMLVRLTEKGRQQRREPDTHDIFAVLSPEEQQVFGIFLDRVIAALEAEVGDGPEDEFERLRAARARMGDEVFERFTSAMHGGHPFRGGFGPYGGCGYGPRGGFRHGGHCGGDFPRRDKEPDSEE